MTAAEIDRVDAAIAAVRTPSPVVGPVRLVEVFDEFDLLRVELPGLSRARVYDWLLMSGHTPPDLGEDQDLAGFLYVAATVGVVFVNADDIVSRKRYSAAHELGHFLLHRDAMHGGRWIADEPKTIRDVNDDATKRHEWEANRFAAELLMPAGVCRARAERLRADLPGVPASVLVHRLAADLLVSREAMGYRLKQMRVTHDRDD